MSMDARKSTVFAFQFGKPVSQTITYLIQNTVSEDQLWSVKCTAVGYAQISSISIPFQQAMQTIAMGKLDENRPLWNAFKRI